MTYQPQYPMPYQPASYGFPPTIDQLLAPARRAGLTMIVLGSIMLLCGICVGGISFVSTEAFWAQMQQQGQNLPPGIDRETMTMGMAVAGGGLSVLGLLYLILGALSRGGGRAWLIISSMIIGLSMLIVLIGTGSAIVNLASNPGNIVSVAINLLILGLLVLVMVWLVQGVKRSDDVDRFRAGQQGGATGYAAGYPAGYPGGYPQQYAPPYSPYAQPNSPPNVQPPPQQQPQQQPPQQPPQA